MWHLGSWFSSGLGSVVLTFRLDGLRGIFQPKCFYEFPSCWQNTNFEQQQLTANFWPNITVKFKSTTMSTATKNNPSGFLQTRSKPFITIYVIKTLLFVGSYLLLATQLNISIQKSAQHYRTFETTAISEITMMLISWHTSPLFS